MDSENKFIKRDIISDLLYGRDEYIKEFAEATKESFGEFRENYRENVLNRNLSKLRDAGHKIKPVSKMLNLPMIIDEYEHAKDLLEKSDVTDKKLEESVNRMENYIKRILDELDEFM